jgi:predicted RND superfamily exporter protein
VILAGGFLVLGLAEIRSIAWFGVLTSFAVIVAILTDMLLLPALARLFSGSSYRQMPTSSL